jgi:dienelactone hydrolase
MVNVGEASVKRGTMLTVAGLLCVLLAAPTMARSTAARAPETVHFLSEDGVTRLTGYLFLPGAQGRRGAVVMMHGRQGSYSSSARGLYTAETLTRRHQEWGRFWAERGYVGLHVDGFGPRGHPGGFAAGTYQDRPGDVDEVMTRPLDAYGALRYLRSRADVIPDRIALQGWSNGASATLSTMARNAPGIENPSPATGFRLALAFYPGCGLRERYKRDYAPYAPILVFIAAEDEEVSPAICEELVATARRNGADVASIVYPGATHDFDDPGPTRQGVEANRRATADAKGRAEAFLTLHFGPRP